MLMGWCWEEEEDEADVCQAAGAARECWWMQVHIHHGSLQVWR